MYSQDQLKKEIKAKILWLMENNGATLHPDWITQAILADHPDVQGADTDFHLCCSRLTIRKEVTQEINKIEEPKTKEKSGWLDGFQHLQEYYVVVRENERIAVRSEHLSDEELEAKASEYEAMGKACYEHADEIRRYKKLRAEAA